MTLQEFGAVLARVERQLERRGVRRPKSAVVGQMSPYEPLARARAWVDAARRALDKLANDAKAAVRNQLKRLGDAAFDVVDKGSAAIENAAKSLAWEAWKAAMPPVLVALGLWVILNRLAR
jgi:lysophospholipase L1-like esterase